ncbi:hypothetical protein OH76DRAFT_238234 [Lentinus brumalis]|uniref:Uncharacterized protein n=1 Tax=Lentinus brumalis TaxID=2498619 RepID=A0A371DHN3_9APHY|nr:hypothetical protein OH76DRAFT_238234 [Polyporus brumalis]
MPLLTFVLYLCLLPHPHRSSMNGHCIISHTYDDLPPRTMDIHSNFSVHLLLLLALFTMMRCAFPRIVHPSNSVTAFTNSILNRCDE